MSAYKKLLSRQHLNSIHPLDKTTREFIGDRLQSETFEKGSLICKPGEILNRVFLIKRGLVRGFYQLNGKEITNWVSCDDEFFSSGGFFKQTPANEYIDAIEATQVDYLCFDDLQEAMQRFPEFVHLMNKLLAEYYAAAEIRALLSRIPGAAARFNFMISLHAPETIRRIPNKYLASYLNMRPETLSRLINNHSDADEPSTDPLHDGGWRPWE